MEDEIKDNEYIRTDTGKIDKVINANYYMPQYIECEKNLIFKNSIVKHSPNLKDIIQKDDFVNKCRVYEVEEKGITVYQTVENSATDYNWISFDEIQEVVTKEMMESISYKVTKM